MEKKLHILFTQATNAPYNVSAFLDTRNRLENNDIIAITFSAIHEGMNNIVNTPDILLIKDSYSFSDNDIERLTSLICKIQKVYVVYHPTAQTATQQIEIRKICKAQGKHLYDVSEHHDPGNPAADALSKIISALPNNGNEGNEGNEEIYKQGLEELLDKPDYSDPFLESFIHLHKSLNLLHFKMKDNILDDEDLKTEIAKIKNKNELKLAVEEFLPETETVTPETLEVKITAIENEIVKVSTKR